MTLSVAQNNVKNRHITCLICRKTSWRWRLVSIFFDMTILKPIHFLAVLISLLCLSSVHATAQSTPNQTSPLGTNLSFVYYYSSEQPFLNIFKTGGGWTTRNSSGVTTGEEVALYQNFLDANGYPTTLTPGGSYQFSQVSVLLLSGLNSTDMTSPTYQAGDYLLQWTGQGTFTYNYDPGSGTCAVSPCKITVGSPSSTGILLTLTRTGSGSNHAQNISFIYCGTWNGSSCSNGYDTLLANGEMFNPSFINKISSFKTLRLKDWMATENNFQTNWSDRPLPGWVFWDDSRTNATINGADPRSVVVNINDGVPAEVMFALCNEVQADCWFNMPALATDDYVTQFATLAHSTLNSSSKVYVEYANEVWGQVFAAQQSGNIETAPLNNASVWQQIENLGYGAYPGFGNPSFGSALWYGVMRAVQFGQDWKNAWGSDAARVIRVLGGQIDYATGRNDCMLAQYPNGASAPCGSRSLGGPTYWFGTTGGTAAQNVDALAVAPYFGYAVPDTFTLDQLFTEIMSGGLVSGGYPGGMIQQALGYVGKNYSLTEAAGLLLVAYEGGQTLVDYSHSDTVLEALYAAANRDPRMGAAYTTLLNGWRSGGGTLFINYTDIQLYTLFGYWGALENYRDTTSPKYNALTGFISSNPCWWSGCATSGSSTTPAPATTTSPPSVPTGVAGTVTSATQINLTWTASTDSAGSVAGYNVLRNGTKVGTSTNTSYQDTGLSVGTTYTYTVSAYNAAGNTSGQSSSLAVATPTGPRIVISSPLNGTLLKGKTNS